MSANPKWGAGPWDDEPDSLDWTDEATGLLCYIVRNQHSGSLLGYVRVPTGHPCHGKHYDDIDINAHGGLTFSGDKKRDGDYWIGFDCAHINDLIPGVRGFCERDATYKNIAYVRRECESIARQIKEAS